MRDSVFVSSLFLACCVGFFAPRQSVAQDFGIDGRIGHTALSTVGRDTGITYLELFPYVQNGEEQILFGDIRSFLTNDGNLGANLTTGFRFLEPNKLFVLGANTSFSFDQTSEKTFQQIGFGLEGLTSIGNVTTNFYFPVGDDDQIIERSITGTRFVGTTVVVDTLDVIGVAMKGLDASLGFYLPGEVAQRHQMEATLGWYHFEGDNVAGIDGFKIQLDGKISESLSAQTAITNDNTFGTNVTLGLDWRFGKNGLPGNQLERQLRRFVQRNFNVVLSNRTEAGIAVPLVSPTTGVAYNVQHVANRVYILAGPEGFFPVGPIGTTETPWNTVAAAQTAGADIIVLESGTAITENIVLGADQLLIGDATPFQVEDARFGAIDLPVVNSGSNSVPAVPPMLTTTTGNGIVLNNNSHIAGVMIDSPTGIGILADGVTGFSVKDVTIKNATGNAIELRNISEGTFSNITIDGGNQDGILVQDSFYDSTTEERLNFENIFVSNVAGNGINIMGGNGLIDFKGDVILNDNTTSGLRITGMETVVEVDDQGTVDTDDDVSTDLFAAILFESLEVNASNYAQGVHLDNNEGLISIGNLDVDLTPLQYTLPPGVIVRLAYPYGTALFVKDTELLVVNDGNLNTTSVTAIDSENSKIDIFLSSLSVDGGPLGVGLKQTEGRLFIRGDQENLTAESGGVIQNTDVAFRMESSGSIALQLMKFSGNGTILEATNSELFKISRSEVTGTTKQFINTLNLRALEIDQSTFEDNTLSSQAGVSYNVSEVGGYVVRVANNLVVDSPEIFFDTKATVGGELASLNYIFTQNEIQMDKASGIASRLEWIGAVSSTISNNLITGDSTNQMGFQFITQDSNSTSTFILSQNGIGFTEANAVAIDMNLGGPAVTNLSQNVLEFAGRDGLGIQVTASKASRFTLAENKIDDNAGGATGILFSSLHDGSNISLEGNLIDLSNFNAFVDRGIIFSTVTGIDDPFITLESNTSNTISGASTTFSVPANSIKGRAIINGQILQQ